MVTGGAFLGVTTVTTAYEKSFHLMGAWEVVAAIYLGKNGGWGKLMDCVRDETGLPVMGTYRATGRGGLTRVLGTVEKMKQFYQLIGSELDMSQYVVDR